jgi:chromosome segregation ATPase
MNKIVLIIFVCVLVGGIVAVTGAWKHIPYLSDAIWASGITIPLDNAQHTVMDTVRSNPQALLGMTGAAVTGSVALLKTFKTRITEFREARQLASETLGGITENFNALKKEYDALTVEKDNLVKEVGDLKIQLLEQTDMYSNYAKVIDAKDAQIKKLQTQQDELHEVIKRAKLSTDEAIVKTVVL